MTASLRPALNTLAPCAYVALEMYKIISVLDVLLLTSHLSQWYLRKHI